MKRTSPGILLLSAVIGLAVGFLLDNALTAAGRPTFTPVITLPILLVLLGLLTLALAIPIRRATRGRAGAPVNPFRALRVAMLAKASSIVGAAVGGLAVGLLVFLLTRPVSPSVGSVGAIILTGVACAILITAALISEHLCTIRKDDDDEHPGAGGDAGLSDRSH
ncbi:DUF3180 domain-containing protein [Microbacterium rhizomatis]|uniref:DUF3180 domain-containing protein n=1 Tax=Microbacterium rhizomatis TaxID=1631477 RepID=A0A5J5J2I8_9MICO|nr:DUF3180 domain-containing protein [Microbacterium rhizomatis]KAA9106518.1 DUF3180 domain-containing protein [Microbacterium rhizomatis]